MVKKLIRNLLALLLIMIICLSNISIVLAATTTELKNQQSELDKKIDELNTEKTAIKAQKSQALTQINSLNSQISTFEGEISNLEQRIIDVNAQIAEKTANLEIEQENFDNQKAGLEKRLIAMYETGGTTYLDMLLNSDGFADFVSKCYLINTIAEYDRELLEKIQNQRDKVKAEKDYLESAKQELETAQNDIKSKKSSLASAVSSKQSLVNNLSAEEKEVQEELEQFEKDKAEIARQLAAIANKNGSVTPVAPSAAGYTSPLPGRTKGSITCGYGAYKGHTGVDFACPAGTTVMAVKSGTVVISTAMRSSNGNYRSYGEYVIINHNDGTMTLYAHMLSGSRTVSPGQTVSQGQAIGQVGSTGNSTGNHLHFEVRVGGYPVNPTPYLP